jgi:hypothetical protein
LSILSSIIKLPWTGAKVIASVVAMGSTLSDSEVKFSRPEIHLRENYIIVEGRVDGGYNSKVEEIILSSTPIKIEYQLKVDDRSRTFSKLYSFDPFNRDCSLLNLSNHIKKSFPQDSLKYYFETYSFTLEDRSEERIIEISAKAEIYSDEKKGSVKFWDENPYLKFVLKE